MQSEIKGGHVKKKTKVPAGPRADRPRMPKEPILTTVTAPLTFKLDFDFERFSSGSMRMTVSDVCATVSDAKGEKVGVVQAALGGGVQVIFGEDRAFFLSYKDLWEAARLADQRYKEGLGHGQ